MSIVSDALALEGKVTYNFGSTDIAGGTGDCSAFTQYVFAQNGISIGRDTRAQLQQGVAVEKDELQPGDLVFFEGTYREGVSHVGIYIGDGKMMNLENDGAVVADITSGYWANHYMTARRVASEAVAGSTSDVPNFSGTSVTVGTGGVVTSNGTNVWELTWWGNVLVVILCIGCIGGGLFFCYKAFAAQLAGKIPSLDSIGDALNKITPDGGNA